MRSYQSALYLYFALKISFICNQIYIFTACDNIWANPPETCDAYVGQEGGKAINDVACKYSQDIS